MKRRLLGVAGTAVLLPGLLAAAWSPGPATAAAPHPGEVVNPPVVLGVTPHELASAALTDRLLARAPGLDRKVLVRALQAARTAWDTGVAPESSLLTVIDYALPSADRRLWVFDLDTERVLFHERVAHGSGSGLANAQSFSNRPGSHQTSLGLFVTGKTYVGKNGYSMRLHGLEEGVNHRAFERAIVVHGAPYVSDGFVQRQGRIGRSWGCPAVRTAVARPLIDAIKDGSLLFAHYPDQDWLTTSEFLAQDG